MASRTSIELHPGGCRVVAVGPSRRRRGVQSGDVHVEHFVNEELPAAGDPGAITAGIRDIRRSRSFPKRAWVVLWGLHSIHQFLRLPPARPADLAALALREARKELAALESDGEAASAAIMLGQETHAGAQRRREVSLYAVSAAEVRRRIQPIADAGFVVDGVLTPGLALAALSRTRGDDPQSAFVYVALYAQATCVTVVRDGALLFSREIPWGHAGAAASTQDSVGARLAAEVKRSVLYFKQTFRAAVEGVVLCGDLTSLRSLTGPLSDAVGVTVIPLDSLVGIDATALPEPAERFRAEAAGLRLVIGAGANPDPSINLLPAAIHQQRRTRAERWRMAAAVAAALIAVVSVSVMVRTQAPSFEDETRRMEQRLAQLEPEVQRVTQLREASSRLAVQGDALAAFESQGPRLARLLEALSQATPPEIRVRSVGVEARGAAWDATVAGIAVTRDAAAGQAAVNALIERLSASPFTGTAAQPASFRVVTGSGGADNNSSPDSSPVPEGFSGVEFTLKLQVAK